MKICIGPECILPVVVKSQGFCSGHYQQMKNRGYLSPLRKKAGSKPYEEIIREAEAKEKAKEEAERRKQEAANSKCKVDGCNYHVYVYSSGLCSGHYQQKWRGHEEFTPLNTGSPRQDPNAPERRCNTCLRVKPRGEFYLRSNGTPQPECKFCFGSRSRINALKKQGRADEAVEIKKAWDAYVQEGTKTAQNQG